MTVISMVVVFVGMCVTVIFVVVVIVRMRMTVIFVVVVLVGMRMTVILVAVMMMIVSVSYTHLGDSQIMGNKDNSSLPIFADIL